jgi:hypothetical protein
MDGNRRADKCKATLRLLKPLLPTSLPPGEKSVDNEEIWANF